ncbi:MAG: FecR domain-containing protein [Deltaproteobacteria bacterium]|nr:FecR domain-containing protein [Deltaproteobacteria bacterium]MBK8715157.1 FecR domain-containing protein [Deltaproteobacteria bacterium]MBP7285137.1 FecR domain-containing protein [Nannocystaceae bacterium]
MSLTRPHSVRAPLVALALATSCNQVPVDQITQQAGAAAPLADAAATAAKSAEVTAISGPGGLRSSALAEGTFLGKGAKLDAGQSVETPKGTLAEIALTGGTRLRVNEDTGLVVPTEGGEVTLTRGEVVALVDGGVTTPLLVRAADDLIRVEGGEVQIVHAGATRQVAVVHGRAVVESSGQRVELGAGERITAPLAAPERRDRPELSLRPLSETGWSRTFEQAAAAMDAVPRGIGSLTARVPGSQQEQGQKIRLTEQRVSVNITGRMAHTEIEQAFFNERAAVLEGIYRFPLPGDASIAGLDLLVGNTWMQGEIVEKQRARQIFQQIVDATVPRDPALLEWERGNVFKLRLFPIPGRGERRVKLSYTQVLPEVGDAVRYRFPLGGTGASGTTVDNFSLTVNVDKSQLDLAHLDEIDTPMLALDRRDEGNTLQLSTEQKNFQPTYDLGVDLPVAQRESGFSASTHLDQDGQAYFMLTLDPKLEFARDERPVNFAFVVDRSHSTTPELWTVARGMVEAMAGGMESNDRFTVLACDAACDELPSGLQTPTAAAIDATRRFLDEQDMAGASDVGSMMIEAGEALARSGGTDAQKVVVYIGDGSPSSGELAPDKLAGLVRDALPDVRVEALALGARADLVALGAVVEATGGDVVQIDARDDLRELVRDLRLRAQVPMAKNVRLELPDGMVDVRHSEAAGLRPGDELVVTGKLSHPVKGEVTLLADGPQGPVRATFPVDITATRTGAPAQNQHLPRTWAAMQIAHLTKTAGFDAHDRIVALSKDYTVLSRFTALLVLENDAMYREFNVVRTAASTDKWGGKVDANKEAEQPAAEVPGNVQGGLASGPVARHEDVDARKAEPTPTPTEAPPATVTPAPAPPAAAEPKTDRDDNFAPSPDPAPAPRREVAPEEEAEKGGRAQGPASGDFAPDDAPGDLGAALDEGDGSDAEADAASEVRTKDVAKAKKTPAPAKPSSSSSSRPADPWGGGVAFDDERSRRSGGWGGFLRRIPVLKIAASSGPSSKNLATIAGLQRTLALDPTRRSSHGALVRAAIRVGHPEALAFARAWADTDPDHAPALESLADVLASQGDPLAARAYASALEVTPFSKSQHEALARAFASKGDLRRSCSHRRALVSIDPSNLDAHAALAQCLGRSGRVTEARVALRDGMVRTKATSRALALAEAELAAGAPAALPALKGQLKATLTWTGEDDLDIAVVDAKGRRLGATHPLGLTVREAAGLEQVALAKVKKSVFVEVTRNGTGLADEAARPIRAVLELRTPNGKQSFPVVIERGSSRVARVFWSG